MGKKYKRLKKNKFQGEQRCVQLVVAEEEEEEDEDSVVVNWWDVLSIGL